MPADRAAWAALRLLADVADSFFTIAGSGRTMELGRSGRTMLRSTAITGDEVDGAWSRRRRASAASYGVIDKRSPNSAALTLTAFTTLVVLTRARGARGDIERCQQSGASRPTRTRRLLAERW